MFEIISGDFEGATLVGNGLVWFTGDLWPPSKAIGAQVLEGNVKEVTIIDEEYKPKTSHRLGYGVVGGIVGGPLGLIGGALLAGKKKEFYIRVSLTNGKSFVAKVDRKTYAQLCGYKVKEDE